MAGVLKISEAASMALHALVLLAADPGESYSTREIADHLDASSDHLSKVLQRLTKAGFIRPIRGRTGGYTLTKTGDSATLLQVVESLDGAFSRKKCCVAVPGCEGNPCILERLIDSVHEQVVETLGGTKLCDLRSGAGETGAGKREKVGSRPELRVIGGAVAEDALADIAHQRAVRRAGPCPETGFCGV
jgi:Rrf2 family protein